MKLYSVKLNNFKRFKNAEIFFNEPVISIIGANENGKSSILEALLYLNSNKEILSKDITWGTFPQSTNNIIIEAKFRLKDNNYFIIHKLKDGRRVYKLSKISEKDKESRNQLLKIINNFKTTNKKVSNIQKQISFYLERDYILEDNKEK